MNNSMNKKVLIFFTLILPILGFAWFLTTHKKSATVDTLIVGTNAEYPPFTFMENDTIVGFDVDLISEVGKRLGKKIEFRDMPFDVLVPEVQRGSIDVVAAGLTPTPEREKALLFAQCHFTNDPLVIVAKEGDKIALVEQLADKYVIVNDGYTADSYMSTQKCQHLIRLPTAAAAFLALDAGRADAYVSARSIVTYFFKKNGNQGLVAAPIGGTEERYAIAISPKNSALLPSINKAIDDIRSDGTLKSLRDKWGIV